MMRVLPVWQVEYRFDEKNPSLSYFVNANNVFEVMDHFQKINHKERGLPTWLRVSMHDPMMPPVANASAQP